MPPHSRKTAEAPPIEMSEYDETRATARLPNLDIEILHRRPWEGNEEHLMVTLRAVPSFEAFGRLLAASNPLLVWTWMMEAAWSPWMPGSPRHSPRASDHHPCPVSIRAPRAEEIPARTGSGLRDDRGTECDHTRHPRHAPGCSLLSGARV